MKRLRPVKLWTAVLTLCLLLLAGCGGLREGEAVPPPNPPPPDGFAEQDDIPEAPAESETLFETMPETYMFCSGAGAWSTDLYLEPDGSFTGKYHDTDMGSAAGRFPDGTVYLCNFTGKFTEPERLDAHTYAMRLESLELEHPDDGTEEIIDGIRYIYSGPYGLEDAEELRIYLPDTPAADLPEEVLWAARGPYNWEPTEEGTLGLYIIYNMTAEYGFVEYPLTKE